MAIKGNKIEKNLKNSVKVCVYSEIDSTNNEAKRRAQADRGSVTLYVTDCQTAGRGRHGHSFFSPKGSGLYFTLSLPLSGDPADVQRLTCGAAVAVCDAISSLTDRQPKIKWVNDIYIDGKKVAGILAELVLDEQNRPLSVIIGIGINLTTAHFPAEFASKAGCIGDVDPNRLCAAITDGLIDMAALLKHSDSELHEAFHPVMEKYSRLSLCIGKQISYTDVSGEHTATAVAIAPDGSLIVEENQIKKSLHSGEISITPTI